MRNENPASTSYLHSAIISSNTATTITYTVPFRNPPLVFNIGDAFAVRKVLISTRSGWSRQGRSGWCKRSTRHWPNQQQETCFSWNNKNTDTNQVYRIHQRDANHSRRLRLHQSRCWTASQSNPGTSEGGISCQREWRICLYSRIYVSASFGGRWPSHTSSPVPL